MKKLLVVVCVLLVVFVVMAGAAMARPGPRPVHEPTNCTWCHEWVQVGPTMTPNVGLVPRGE